MVFSHRQGFLKVCFLQTWRDHVVLQIKVNLIAKFLGKTKCCLVRSNSNNNNYYYLFDGGSIHQDSIDNVDG